MHTARARIKLARSRGGAPRVPNDLKLLQSPDSSRTSKPPRLLVREESGERPPPLNTKKVRIAYSLAGFLLFSALVSEQLSRMLANNFQWVPTKRTGDILHDAHDSLHVGTSDRCTHNFRGDNLGIAQLRILN